jgi:hypothetical protein
VIFCLDNDTNSGIIETVDNIQKILAKMRLGPVNVRFGEVCRVCDHYFGEPRQKGTSHRIYNVNWVYPPLINVQNFKGKVKDYQVRQVLYAIDKLEEEK